MNVAVPRAIRIIEKRSSIRVRTYASSDPETVFDLLRMERFTGRVVFDMSEGGVCMVQAEDRTHLTSNTNSP